MTNNSPIALSDRALLDATTQAATCERRATTQLVALLAELDSRKLYLGEGYSSLFTFCTLSLHLSEPAAYSRITVARAARRYPEILERMAQGDLNLTTVSLLAAHLTDENCDALLEAARGKSKRHIERLIASIDPQPDVPASVRKLPGRTVTIDLKHWSQEPAIEKLIDTSVLPTQQHDESTAVEPPRAAPRPVIALLAPDRYLLKVTVTRETHAKLERARDLLRHVIPNGDTAAIVDRALTVLVDQLERTKLAKTSCPPARREIPSSGRHVPASVRRSVWSRDVGRCAFVGASGRCAETGFLEFHHVVPFAAGGPTTIENLELRCRSHNAYEASLCGTSSARRADSPDLCGSTLSGRSSTAGVQESFIEPRASPTALTVPGDQGSETRR